MNRSGRFITLEGGEGSGKSTQTALLAARLQEHGIEVIRTREPGGSAGAEAIRDLLVSGDTDRWDGRTEALLHTAARWDHLQKTVFPALDRGAWVVCDRFTDSTMAYQGYGHGLDREFIRDLSRLVLGGFAPDLTFILDIPVEDGLLRAGRRAGGEDRYERMGTAFHERLRQGFLDIANEDTQRCVVLDARLSVEALADTLWQQVRERLL